MQFITKIFFIFFFIVNLLYANQETVNNLAKLSASSLYNLDDEQIALSIKPYLKDKNSIKAVKIIDNTDNSVFFKIFKQDGKYINQKQIPKDILDLKTFVSNIKYDNELIGKVIIFTKDDSLIKFTKEELQWIKTHEVKIGVEQWAPVVFSNNGHDVDGIAGDFIKKIIERTGLKVKIISNNWNTLLTEFEDKKIDILPATYYTKKRAKFGLYSDGYFKMKDSIYFKNTTMGIESLKDLNGRTLAIPKGYGTIEKLQERFPKIKLVFTKDLDDSINRVLNGRVTAFYEGQIAAQAKIEDELIKGLNSISVKAFKAPSLYFFSKIDEPILQSIIQKVLQSISYQEKVSIVSKWVGSNQNIILTEKEQQWIDQEIEIRYAFDPNWKPLEWADEVKEHKGIVSDIIKLIKQKSDLNIKPIYSNSWDDVINKIKSNKADMFVSGDIIDKDHLNFTTKSILTSPYVFISRVSDDYLNGFESLRNKKIGVFKNSSIYNILKKDKPDLKLISFTSDEEALRMIKDDKLDVAILSANLAKYYINMLGYKSTLKIAYKTKYNLELRFGINKSMGQIPLDIINKALESISEKALSDIIDKWTRVRIQSKTNWILLLQVGGIIILIILFILWNNHKLKITVDEKTKDLKDVLDSMEVTINHRTEDLEIAKKDVEQILANILLPVLITHKKTRKILYANKYAQIQYDMTIEDILGSDIDNVYTLLGQKDDILKAILKDGYVENMEQTFKTNNGKIFTALLSVTPINYKGDDCFIGMVTDITKQKEMENEVRAIHKHTRDSIEYASLIQGALIPQAGALEPFFKDHFVTWTPKDTVGGDIWLFNQLRHEDECLLFFIDCTGHGVPGAFVTMIVKSIEREIISNIKKHPEFDISPAIVMGYFNKTMKTLLRQETKDSLSNAGWDGGIIYYNRRTQILKFAGAETPLFYMTKDGEFKTIKGNRYSVGYKKCDSNYEYKETILDVEDGMKFYCTTDGYLDQNGGEKDFPFGKKRFGNIIKEHYTKPMKELQNIFGIEMTSWEEQIPNNDRNDDMTVIGFEVGIRSDFKEKIYDEIIKYEGVMTQNVIATCMDNIEAKITNMGSMGTISTITIEYCQNMMNYSKNDEIGSRDIIPAGKIEVQNINNEYYDISATNIVSIDDKEKIEPKLIEVQSLDKAGIKKRYRELRKSGQNTHEKGGGIGMYEIAKVSDSIEYEFRKINDDKYHFTMRSIVKVKVK